MMHKKIEKLFDKGYELIKNCNYNEAIDIFSKIIKKSSASSKIFELRGLCYFNTSKYLDAIVDFSKAIEINPSDGNLFILRADSYIRIKKI